MAKKFIKGWQAACILLFSGAQLLLAQETIVAFRHGEKPPGGLGQLSCRGLNRALALPNVLTQRFGKPDAIYAPNPSEKIFDGIHRYSYARPLVTIEPTAIALGMPVNAQIGYSQIKPLRAQLTARSHKSELIFVAWEHTMLNEFAKQMLRSYGQSSSAVPKWPDDDYDRIYIFKISQDHGKPELTFEIDHEGLTDSLNDLCPNAVTGAEGVGGVSNSPALTNPKPPTSSEFR